MEHDKQYEINAHVELPPKGWAGRVMDWIIWGNPHQTPITPDNIDLSPSDEVWNYKQSEDGNEPF